MENTTTNMPHNGGLLEKFINESEQRVTTLSHKMGYTRAVLPRLYNTPSMRTHIWWQLGLAVNRNLLAELAERFPIRYQTKRELELEKELIEEKQISEFKLNEAKLELDRVRLELEIYRRIVDKHLEGNPPRKRDDI